MTMSVTTQHRFIVEVSGCSAEEAKQVISERVNHDEDYGFEYRIVIVPHSQVARSKVVPTEYDVYVKDGQVVLNDDRGREFAARTYDEAFAAAEATQNPADPIHHEPFPSPEEVPAP